MHAADVLDAVAHNSERIGGSSVEIAVLAFEAHEENRIAVLVEKLHVHVGLSACSFDVASARYNRIRALVKLQFPQMNENLIRLHAFKSKSYATDKIS